QQCRNFLVAPNERGQGCGKLQPLRRRELGSRGLNAGSNNTRLGEHRPQPVRAEREARDNPVAVLAEESVISTETYQGVRSHGIRRQLGVLPALNGASAVAE